jgi:hypothetical protein
VPARGRCGHVRNGGWLNDHSVNVTGTFAQSIWFRIDAVDQAGAWGAAERYLAW